MTVFFRREDKSNLVSSAQWQKERGGAVLSKFNRVARSSFSSYTFSEPPQLGYNERFIVFISTAPAFSFKVIRSIRNLHKSARTMKNSPFKAHVNSIEHLDSGKWIQTRKINYTDPNGNARVWEMAVRTTRTDYTGIDAVSILGILRGRNNQHSVVLTKQFRPPCGKVVIEFPAGLVDPNESIETTAVRELKEETGYHGSVTNQSIPLFSDPGLTNANMALVTIEIDPTDPRNADPQNQTDLEEGEFIEVISLPLSNLYASLVEICEKEGTSIDARVLHFAEGLRLAAALSK